MVVVSPTSIQRGFYAGTPARSTDPTLFTTARRCRYIAQRAPFLLLQPAPQQTAAVRAPAPEPEPARAAHCELAHRPRLPAQRALVIAGPGRPALPCVRALYLDQSPRLPEAVSQLNEAAVSISARSGRQGPARVLCLCYATIALAQRSPAGYARPSRLTAPAYAGTVTTRRPRPALPQLRPPAPPPPAQQQRRRQQRQRLHGRVRTRRRRLRLRLLLISRPARCAIPTSPPYSRPRRARPQPAQGPDHRIPPDHRARTRSPTATLTALDGRLPCPLHWAWRRREAAAQDRWRRAGDGQTRDAPQQRARPWPRVARLPTRGETCIRWKEPLCLPANCSRDRSSLSARPGKPVCSSTALDERVCFCCAAVDQTRPVVSGEWCRPH